MHLMVVSTWEPATAAPKHTHIYYGSTGQVSAFQAWSVTKTCTSECFKGWYDAISKKSVYHAVMTVLQRSPRYVCWSQNANCPWCLDESSVSCGRVSLDIRAEQQWGRMLPLCRVSGDTQNCVVDHSVTELYGPYLVLSRTHIICMFLAWTNLWRGRQMSLFFLKKRGRGKKEYNKYSTKHWNLSGELDQCLGRGQWDK